MKYSVNPNPKVEKIEDRHMESLGVMCKVGREYYLGKWRQIFDRQIFVFTLTDPIPMSEAPKDIEKNDRWGYQSQEINGWYSARRGYYQPLSTLE
jgi:hypothetical protein